jgi:predicted dehydrogenase
MTNSLAEARDLVSAVQAGDLVFALTHNYTGYPMVRLARDLVAAGEIGELRNLNTEFVAEYETNPLKPQWRHDPLRAGPVGCLGDIGSHAEHLARYVTGQMPSAVCADLRSFVPGRQVDDHAAVLLRYSGGARGVLWSTTVAPGNECGLRLRAFGSAGGLEWNHDYPNELRYTRYGRQPEILTRAGHRQSAAAQRASRFGAGHAEGYFEAFANLYAEVAEVITARLERREPHALAFQFPTVVDGARGVAFLEAAARSHAAGGVWEQIEAVA